MYDVGGVDVLLRRKRLRAEKDSRRHFTCLHASQYLIQEILNMRIRQLLTGADDLM